MTWRVIEADCVEAMKEMDEASVDAICTDPPYSLRFMSRAWDDQGEGAQIEESHRAWATEALRVLKPGGHLLAFGGTRTYHRLACAIEDGGFEIRDSVIWLYGSGFPKSLDVSKAIDRARDDGPAIRRVTSFVASHRDGRTNGDIDGHFGFNGMAGHWTTQGDQAAVPTLPQWVELKSLLSLPDDMDAEVWRLNGRKGQPGENWEKREKIGVSPHSAQREQGGMFVGEDEGIRELTAPATPEAQRWQGWGTALKPAHEPIVVARKPLIGTVAQNVERFGTGALNIDASRIGTDEALGRLNHTTSGFVDSANGTREPHPRTIEVDNSTGKGRWPANVALSHLPECERVGERRVKGTGTREGGDVSNRVTALEGGERVRTDHEGYADPDGLETVEAWSCVEGCPILELDRQSGESLSAGGRGRWIGDADVYGGGGQPAVGDPGYGDTGGASRYFATFPWKYQAKASRSERNAGLEGFEAGDGAAIRPQSRECNVCGSRSKRPGKPWPACAHDDWQWVEDKTASGVEGRDKGALRNAHPT